MQPPLYLISVSWPMLRCRPACSSETRRSTATTSGRGLLTSALHVSFSLSPSVSLIEVADPADRLPAIAGHLCFKSLHRLSFRRALLMLSGTLEVQHDPDAQLLPLFSLIAAIFFFILIIKTMIETIWSLCLFHLHPPPTPSKPPVPWS